MSRQVLTFLVYLVVTIILLITFTTATTTVTTIQQLVLPLWKTLPGPSQPSFLVWLGKPSGVLGEIIIFWVLSPKKLFFGLALFYMPIHAYYTYKEAKLDFIMRQTFTIYLNALVME